MGKRFTETDKWKDKWFRALPPEMKLAWMYLLDNCDHAGVIDLDRELAEFQIGEEVDWDAFLQIAEDRVSVISNGKLHLTKFIHFQYGTLSKECRAHTPVFNALQRHRLSEGYPKGIHTHKEKEQDKDKETDKDKEQDSGNSSDGYFGPEKPKLWGEFLKYFFKKTGQDMDSISEKALLSRLWSAYPDPKEHDEIVLFTMSVGAQNLILNGNHKNDRRNAFHGKANNSKVEIPF